MILEGDIAIGQFNSGAGKKTKKSVTKPLLKGVVGGTKLSRKAWFSGVVICLSRGLKPVAFALVTDINTEPTQA